MGRGSARGVVGLAEKMGVGVKNSIRQKGFHLAPEKFLIGFGQLEMGHWMLLREDRRRTVEGTNRHSSSFVYRLFYQAVQPPSTRIFCPVM